MENRRGSDKERRAIEVDAHIVDERNGVLSVYVMAVCLAHVCMCRMALAAGVAARGMARSMPDEAEERCGVDSGVLNQATSLCSYGVLICESLFSSAPLPLRCRVGLVVLRGIRDLETVPL